MTVREVRAARVHLIEALPDGSVRILYDEVDGRSPVDVAPGASAPSAPIRRIDPPHGGDLLPTLKLTDTEELILAPLYGRDSAGLDDVGKSLHGDECYPTTDLKAEIKPHLTRINKKILAAGGDYRVGVRKESIERKPR